LGEKTGARDAKLGSLTNSFRPLFLVGAFLSGFVVLKRSNADAFSNRNQTPSSPALSGIQDNPPLEDYISAPTIETQFQGLPTFTGPSVDAALVFR